MHVTQTIPVVDKNSHTDKLKQCRQPARQTRRKDVHSVFKNTPISFAALEFMATCRTCYDY